MTDNLKPFLYQTIQQKQAAIFLSGSGTNAEKVIEYWRENNSTNWSPAVIVTDTPQKSRAAEIAQLNNIPLIEHDIRAFYKANCLNRISILTPEGQAVREKWTNKLREMLIPYNIDFGILAGFVPLTNITSDFPCLNIHPGDLTVEQNGKRLLVGLHTIPIELAIINGFSSLRSSVIIAQTYTGRGGEMDSGPILGISPEVPIDFKSYSRNELIKIFNDRPKKRPVGGYKDALEELAKHNQEILKINGDWIVFPRAIEDFASNKFRINSKDQLHYCEKNTCKRIQTVVYYKNMKKIFDKAF